MSVESFRRKIFSDTDVIGGDSSFFSSRSTSRSNATAAANPDAILSFLGMDNCEVRDKIVRNLVSDPRSAIRDQIDSEMASKITERLSKNRSVRVNVSAVLSPAEESLLCANFPELDIHFTRKEVASHAYSWASRTCETEICLQAVGYDSRRVLPDGFLSQIVDVGGNWLTHIFRGRSSIHSCCPTLSHYDDLRESKRLSIANGVTFRSGNDVNTTEWNSNLRLFKERKTRFRIRCNRPFQECRLRARAAIFVHSIYDISLEEIANTFLKRGISVGAGSFVFSPQILFEDEGIIPGIEMHYSINRKTDVITFSFRNDASYTYSHTFTQYLSILKTSVFTDSKKKACFYLELTTNRSGIQFFTITRGTAKSVPKSVLSHKIWYPYAADHLRVHYYDLDISEHRLSRSLVPVSFTVPRKLTEEIRNYAYRLQDSKFNPSELYSYAASVNTREILSGKDVLMREPVATRTLQCLTHSVYIEAFVRRYNDGCVDKVILDRIKGDRIVAHGYLFSKLFLFSTNCIKRLFQNSLWNELHHLLTYLCVNRDTLNVNIEEMVQFETFEDAISAFDSSLSEVDPFDVPHVPLDPLVDAKGAVSRAVDDFLAEKESDSDSDSDHSSAQSLPEPSHKPPISAPPISQKIESYMGRECDVPYCGEDLCFSWDPSRGDPVLPKDSVLSPPSILKQDLPSDRVCVFVRNCETGVLTLRPDGSVYNPSSLSGDSLYLESVPVCDFSVPGVGFSRADNKLHVCKPIVNSLPVSDTVYRSSKSAAEVLSKKQKKKNLKQTFKKLLTDPVSLFAQNPDDAFSSEIRSSSSSSCGSFRKLISPSSRSSSTDFPPVNNIYLLHQEEEPVVEDMTPSVRPDLSLPTARTPQPIASTSAVSDALTIQSENPVCETPFPVVPVLPYLVTPVPRCDVPLESIPTPGDGNCFYHAYLLTRGSGMSVLELKAFILDRCSTSYLPDSVRDLLVTPNAWATDEIVALTAYHLDRNICLHNLDNGTHTLYHNSVLSREAVHISISNNHFSALMVLDRVNGGGLSEHGCGLIRDHLRFDLSIPSNINWTYLKTRRAAFFSFDPDFSYGHDVVTYATNPVPESFKSLFNEVSRISGCVYNTVLINEYLSESSSLNFHRDDEPCYSDANPIVTWNAAGTCSFLTAHRPKSPNCSEDELSPFDVLIMPPGFQRTHYHSVIKCSQGRISLTFRVHYPNSKRGSSEAVSRSRPNTPSLRDPSPASHPTLITTKQTPTAAVSDSSGKPNSQSSHDSAPVVTRDSALGELSNYWHLSPIHQEQWRKFLPKTVVGDSLKTQALNAAYEAIELWRVHDAVLSALYADVYRDLPKHLSRRDVSKLTKDSHCFGLWDNERHRWEVKPRRVTAHRFGFDGKRFVPFFSTRLDRGEPEDVLLSKEANRRVRSDVKRILVSAETHLMLEHQFYDECRSFLEVSPDEFEIPKFSLIQGVPGCGKTHHIIENHTPSVPTTPKPGRPLSIKVKGDLVLTASREAAADLRKRLAAKKIFVTSAQYSTSDSYLLNRRSSGWKAMWFDEALMKHPGEIVLAAFYSKCSEVKLLGDIAQIPFICRLPMIDLKYHKLTSIAPITQELSVTYRCPIDVAVAISDHYPSGIRSANPVRKSLSCVRVHTLANVPNQPDTQYLTFKQAEMEEMRLAGYKLVSTVHQFQGKSAKRVAVVRLSHKPLENIYLSSNHVVTAISRHTESLVYYTPVLTDDLSRRISRVPSAAEATKHTHYVDVPNLKVSGGFVFSSAPPPQALFSPQVKCGSVEALQQWYDSVLPGDSVHDLQHDQVIIHHSDRSLPVVDTSLDRIGKSPLKPLRPRLVPRLRTSISHPRASSQLETLLALVKRNLNVPELSAIVDESALVDLMLDKFVSNYITPTGREVLNIFSQRPITPSSVAIDEWLKGQPKSVVDQIAPTAPIWEKRVDLYHFMNKNSAKPVLDGTAPFEYLAVQTIAFHDKDINAIFCPIFREVMSRLESILRPDTLINTHMSPDELGEKIDGILPVEKAEGLDRLEIDISKYDKSQGRVLLQFELRLYAMLGVPPYLLYLWYRAHDSSTLKDYAHRISTEVVYQRKSGDAATFLGNTVVLMGVIATLFDLQDVPLRLFAGDDSLLIGNGLSVDRNRLCAEMFNLESKFFHYAHSMFCSKFIIPVGANWKVLPDPLKLVTKLGRHDVCDYDHAEEYRTSLLDLCSSYRNACCNLPLSAAFNERYGYTARDHGFILASIANLISSKDQFASLFSLPSEPLLNDPSKPKLN